MLKKMILLLVLGLMVAGAAAMVIHNRRAEGEATARALKAKQAPVPVRLSAVTTQAVPMDISTFGTVEPLTTVAVKSQITGILAKVLFSEGQTVQEGALLFELDPRGPEAALKQAEAALDKDRVQCANAVKEAGRMELLLKKGFVAQELRDQTETAAEMLKAMVRSDEAAVDHARLQLSYCSLRSPVSGRTGTLLIHQGNLVKADDTTLVTINQLSPIRVRFVLPQRELATVQRRLEQGALTLMATPQGVGALTVTGTVTFVDNVVDQATGTILLKAQFENSPAALWPGQFVKVVLRLALQEDAVVIPESAVLLGQQGAYVYVADQNSSVSIRPVTVDRTVAGMSVITTGLLPGEVVVTDGQLRLKPGSRVKPRDSSPAGRP